MFKLNLSLFCKANQKEGVIAHVKMLLKAEYELFEIIGVDEQESIIAVGVSYQTIEEIENFSKEQLPTLLKSFQETWGEEVMTNVSVMKAIK